jgi:hypothetical protein
MGASHDPHKKSFSPGKISPVINVSQGHVAQGNPCISAPTSVFLVKTIVGALMQNISFGSLILSSLIKINKF